MDDTDLEIRTIRAQEMSIYVERGYLDCGITGLDWIQENNSRFRRLANFSSAKPPAGPPAGFGCAGKSRIKSVKDLEGKLIATEVVGMTKRWLKKHGVKADVEFSGAPLR